MTAERKPAEVFLLAEHLCDELVARGWKTADCARHFDNGCSQAFNLLLLNTLMLAHTKDAAPMLLIRGLSNALGISEEMLRTLDDATRHYADRVSHWVCPIEILSQDMTDYIL